MAKKKPKYPEPKTQAEEIVDKVRELIGNSTCGEAELYELLCAEAEGWEMRLDELEQEGD